MEYVDRDVVKYLTGSQTVRDGNLAAFSVRSVEMQAEVELVFEMYLERPVRIVKLSLQGVKEWSFGYDDAHQFWHVTHLKCLWTTEGEFFISLDPYDERDAQPSDDDNAYFRSISARVSVEHEIV